MKFQVLVQSPYESWLAQDAPPEITIDYPETIERRGGFQEVNWVEVTIGISGPIALKLAWDYLGRFRKRFPMKIRTGQNIDGLDYEAFEQIIKKETQKK